MMKEGVKAKTKLEHLVSSHKGRLRTIHSNSQLIGKLF